MKIDYRQVNIRHALTYRKGHGRAHLATHALWAVPFTRRIPDHDASLQCTLNLSLQVK